MTTSAGADMQSVTQLYLSQQRLLFAGSPFCSTLCISADKMILTPVSDSQLSRPGQWPPLPASSGVTQQTEYSTGHREIEWKHQIFVIAAHLLSGLQTLKTRLKLVSFGQLMCIIQQQRLNSNIILLKIEIQYDFETRKSSMFWHSWLLCVTNITSACGLCRVSALRTLHPISWRWTVRAGLAPSEHQMCVTSARSDLEWHQGSGPVTTVTRVSHWHCQRDKSDK